MSLINRPYIVSTYPSYGTTSTTNGVEYYQEATPSISDIVAAVKKSMEHERVLEKCESCGQWGAVMCACPHCGAPIDPKE